MGHLKLALCYGLGAMLSFGAHASKVEAQDASSISPSCVAPDGWESVADTEPQFVVFGELHGTQEAPHFVGNLACALALRGERILLGIEHSASNDAALQLAWKLPASEFRRALREIGWLGRMDGVASEAMFAMLVRAHSLKEQGLPINVVAFNGFRDKEQSERFAGLPGQGPHEAAQAQNIAGAAAAGVYDRVLVLVGNFHARTDEVEVGGNRFDPMAKRLTRFGKTVALDMRYAAGTSWNCLLKPGFRPEPGQSVRTEDLECGNHPTRGNAEFDASPFIELSASPGEGPAIGYDGIFWLGPITGSPPLLFTGKGAGIAADK